MAKVVINVADAETHTETSGEYFGYSMTELASALGAKAIGANLTRVPPGKAAFPFHHHYGNEEHFFVISGSGVLRANDDTHDIREHDYIVHWPATVAEPEPPLEPPVTNSGSHGLCMWP